MRDLDAFLVEGERTNDEMRDCFLPLPSPDSSPFIAPTAPPARRFSDTGVFVALARSS